MTFPLVAGQGSAVAARRGVATHVLARQGLAGMAGQSGRVSDRQGSAWQVPAGHGKAGSVGLGALWPGRARQGRAWQARLGRAGYGAVRPVEVWRGRAWQGMERVRCLGTARLGMARHRSAWHGRRGGSGQGGAGPGGSRQGMAGKAIPLDSRATRLIFTVDPTARRQADDRLLPHQRRRRPHPPTRTPPSRTGSAAHPSTCGRRCR